MMLVGNTHSETINGYLVSGRYSPVKNDGNPRNITPESLNKNLTAMNGFYRDSGFSQVRADNEQAVDDNRKGLKNINIVYTNDLHGSILPNKKASGETTGGIARVGTVIKDLKKDGNALVVDGGDWAQGSYESGVTKGKTMIDVMNDVGYDAAEIGNHEFDWSQKDLQNMAEKASFPILGANIEKEKPGVLQYIKPYTIKEVNGVKVGILGLVTPEVSTLSKPQNMEGLKALDPKETAEKYIKEMKKQGVDNIVVVTHQADEDIEKLAKDVKGIDVIVSGHSHNAMKEAKNIDGTIIVESGSKGEFVGNLQLTVDEKTKKIVSFNNQLIPINDSIKPDPEVEKIIAPAIEEAKKKKSEIVGESEIDLTHNNRKTESILGDVITDAMREKTGSDIAFLNSGGMRTEINKGKISFGDLHNVLPFENKTVTMDLTGSQIKDLLEKSPWTKKNDLQVSGMTMDIDSNKSEGERLSNIRIHGKPIDIDKTYRVTADDFLSSGGADYSTFKEGKNKVVGDLVIDALKDYMNKHVIGTDTAREKRINYN